MKEKEIKFTSTIIENLKWVWKIWKQYKPMLFILISFGFISGFAIAAGPYVLKIVVDKISEVIKNDPKLLLAERKEFLMYIIGIGIFQFFAYLYPGFRGVMNHMLEYEIRSSVFKKLMDKTHAFFMKYRSGDIITRLTDDLSDFPKVAWFLCSGIFRAFNAVCVVLGSAILMLSIHFGLTVCALLTLPFCGGVFAAFHGKIKATFEAKQKAVSSTNSYLESCLSGIDIIKAYNATERENLRFRKIIDERIKIETEVVKIQSFFNSFFPNISFFGQLLVI
ncbi:ABC transporter ATP-binding protein, partial [bacterium]|nr:ABC transporter ATP-binding protein [bacterium]